MLCCHLCVFIQCLQIITKKKEMTEVLLHFNVFYYNMELKINMMKQGKKIALPSWRTTCMMEYQKLNVLSALFLYH